MDSVTRIGHWEYEDYALDGSDANVFKYSATLDIESLVSDFRKGLREKEDAVLETIVVDWLRGRGWTVER